MSGRDEPTMENKSLLRHKTMATATTTTTSASPLQRRHRVASSSSSSQSACLASAYLRRFALCSSSLALSFCISCSLSLLFLPSLSLFLSLARACSLELLMKIVLNPKRKHCPPPSSAAHKANHPHRLILITHHSRTQSTVQLIRSATRFCFCIRNYFEQKRN